MPSRQRRTKEPVLSYIDLVSGVKLPRKGFYLVSGEDNFAFTQLEKVFTREFLPDDPSGFNKARFECDSNTKAADLINVCEEYPFGSEYKLVIISQAQKMASAEGDKLAHYLENPSPASVIVIFENTAKGRSASGKFSPSRKLKKQLKNGLHVKCSLNYKELRTWARERLKKEGKKISQNSLEALIEQAGTDLWDLSQEIVKLALYTGKRDTILSDDVKAVVSHKTQSKIYNLTEQVGLKNLGGALKILEELLQDKNTAFIIPSSINNHIGFLYRISRLYEEGMNHEEIAKTLKKHPFYVKKTLRQVKKFSPASYEKAFDILARADGGIKSGMDHRRVLELVVFQICRLK